MTYLAIKGVIHQRKHDGEQWTRVSDELAKRIVREWVGMQWQPIETAPMDGTHILLVCQYRVDGRLFSSSCWVDFWMDEEWTHWPRIIDAPFHATHWMPLPTAPTDTEDA